MPGVHIGARTCERSLLMPHVVDERATAANAIGDDDLHPEPR